MLRSGGAAGGAEVGGRHATGQHLLEGDQPLVVVVELLREPAHEVRDPYQLHDDGQQQRRNRCQDGDLRAGHGGYGSGVVEVLEGVAVAALFAACSTAMMRAEPAATTSRTEVGRLPRFT